jgi:integrase
VRLTRRHDDQVAVRCVTPTGDHDLATLNRELAALRRAFRLGIEQDRIAHAPVIKLLAEHNVRQGFVEPGTFEEIVKRLPGPIDDVARFGFITGWRKQEILSLHLSLQWSDVDLENRRIRLRRENSKNEEPRVLVLTADLLALIQRRWAARQYQTKMGVALSRWVFHRRGQRVVDFRDAWAEACTAAKVPGLLFHDLRRSAVRNMEKSGAVTPAVGHEDHRPQDRQHLPPGVAQAGAGQQRGQSQ